MKNLLVYVNPDRKFDPIYGKMAEIQIDNSLDFWKPADIIMATNFPYEYHGIKSTFVPDDLCCDFYIKTSKDNVIVYLLENKILNELTWDHDFDAFQLAPLDPPPLDRDIYFTSYTYKPQINMGSSIFNPGALEVWMWIRDEMYKYQTHDEHAVKKLLRKNKHNIYSRFRILNATYNIGMRHTYDILRYAERPIRVVHFPPHWKKTYDMFKPILTENLIKLIDEKYYNE